MPTHQLGWPLWTLTYRSGRSTKTTSFFSATAETARAYGEKWVGDLVTLSGRGASLVSVRVA